MENRNIPRSAQPNLFEEQVYNEYASFFQRFLALLVDFILLFALRFILDSIDEVFFDNYSIIPFCINCLYFTLMDSGPFQGTLGKRALGLKIVDLDGRRIHFGRALGRFFARFLSILLFFFGFLMVLWDRDRQSLHDKIAGTLVVRNVHGLWV